MYLTCKTIRFYVAYGIEKHGKAAPEIFSVISNYI